MCRTPREITQQVEKTHVKLVEVEETKIIKMTAQFEVPKITQQVENTHAKHVEEEDPEIIKMTAKESRDSDDHAAKREPGGANFKCRISPKYFSNVHAALLVFTDNSDKGGLKCWTEVLFEDFSTV